MMDKIVCVGKNYLEHAKELGDAVPDKPVLFLKPPSVITQAQGWGQTVAVSIPRDAGSLHHECEIVLRVCVSGGAKTIDAVTLGLDLTLRERQNLLKKNGHPWTTAKVFPGSAVMGPWLSVQEFPKYREEEFSLSVNNAMRQVGYGTEMRFGPQELLAYISTYFELCHGDAIFTGTPAGVGPLAVGDKARVAWAGWFYDVEFR